LAALAVARALKIPDKISFKALSEYRGSWRRFEIKKIKIGNWKLEIISDYGHHPTEIKTTLKAAREKYPKKKIWCIFQPHQYHRTYRLFDDFIMVFKQTMDKFFINKLIITDIYSVPGREKEYLKKKVSSQKLVKIINKTLRDFVSSTTQIEQSKDQCKGENKIFATTLCSTSSCLREKVIYLRKENILNYLKNNLQGGEVIIIMGAGDIYDLDIYLSNQFI